MAKQYNLKPETESKGIDKVTVTGVFVICNCDECGGSTAFRWHNDTDRENLVRNLKRNGHICEGCQNKKANEMNKDYNDGRADIYG